MCVRCNPLVQLLLGLLDQVHDVAFGTVPTATSCQTCASYSDTVCRYVYTCLCVLIALSVEQHQMGYSNARCRAAPNVNIVMCMSSRILCILRPRRPMESSSEEEESSDDDPEAGPHGHRRVSQVGLQHKQATARLLCFPSNERISSFAIPQQQQQHARSE